MQAETVREHLLDECTMHASRQGDDLLDLDSRRLDHVAADIAAEARLRSASYTRQGNVALAAILDGLAADLDGADCQRCASARGSAMPCGRVVAGKLVDHNLVEQRGECIADLLEVYDFAVLLGSDLYSDACKGIGPAKLVDLKLRTKVLAPTSPSSGSVRLAARTDFETEAGRHESIITLAVDGANYGSFEREAVAYYLIHEVVAHAFYNAFLIGNRSHLDPHDLWAEGWMDCIAADLLIGALEGRHASSQPPRRMRGNQSTIDVVQGCHARRYDPANGTASHALNGMRLARNRYQTMRYRLQSLSPRTTFDPMRIVQLACAIINANGAAAETIGAINSAAGAFLFGARGGPELTAEEMRFYRAIASFIEHRDEKRLVGELS